MKESKRKKLEQAGWTIGDASEFLELSEAEEMIVKVRLALATEVKQQRKRLKMTQDQLAKQIGSSQSRVAKVETADKSVSIDLLFRSLALMGTTREEIGRVIAATSATKKSSQRTSKKKVKKRAVNTKTAAGKKAASSLNPARP